MYYQTIYSRMANLNYLDIRSLYHSNYLSPNLHTSYVWGQVLFATAHRLKFVIYLRTYTCIHTYVQAYIHACIHTY